MAEGATVANAFVQIMPSMEGATGSITSAIVPEVSAAGASGGAAFGKNLLSNIKGNLLGAGAAIVGALGVKEIATGLMSIGQEFDEMRDTIIVGTGASGEALDALCDSAKAIATTVPTSFSEAGDVVQNLNTRMNLVGDDLEDVGNRAVAAGKLIGTAVNLDTLTGSFNAFGVANDEAAGKMDYLFNVSQATGIGFNDLTAILEKNAPALTNLGFSFEESANMAGLLDKAGMDASGTMGKMSKALVELAEPGQTAQEAFESVIGEMEGYIEAGDQAAAIEVASKIFGTKGAAQFVGAVQSGAMSLGDIRDAALGAGDGIMGTMEATADWPEKWEILKNKAAEALEPIAGALMDGATKAMDLLGEAIDKVDPAALEELGDAIGQGLTDGIQNVLDFGSFVIDNWPTIATLVGGVTAGFVAFNAALMISETVSAFSAALGVAAGAEDAMAVSQGVLNTVMEANPIVLIVTLLAGLVAALVVAYNTNEEFRDFVNGAWEAVWGVIEPIVTAIGDALTSFGEWLGDMGSNVGQWAEDVNNFWTGVGEKADETFQGVQDTIGGAWDAASSKTSEVWESTTSFLSGKFDELKSSAETAFSSMSDAISTDLQTAQTVGSEAGSALTSALNGDWDAALEHSAAAYDAIRDNITTKLDAAKSTAVSIADQIGSKLGFPGLGAAVAGVFDGIKSAIQDPIGTARDFVKSAIDRISGIITGANLTLPHINLPHFNINGGEVPWGIGGKGYAPSISIDWYAQGGFVEDLTVLGYSGDRMQVAGERGAEFIWPSYEPYLSRYAAALASRMPVRNGEGGAHQNFYIYTNDPEQAAAVVAARQRRALCY